MSWKIIREFEIAVKIFFIIFKKRDEFFLKTKTTTHVSCTPPEVPQRPNSEGNAHARVGKRVSEARAAL